MIFDIFFSHTRGSPVLNLDCWNLKMSGLETMVRATQLWILSFLWRGEDAVLVYWLDRFLWSFIFLGERSNFCDVRFQTITNKLRINLEKYVLYLCLCIHIHIYIHCTQIHIDKYTIYVNLFLDMPFGFHWFSYRGTEVRQFMTLKYHLGETFRIQASHGQFHCKSLWSGIYATIFRFRSNFVKRNTVNSLQWSSVETKKRVLWGNGIPCPGGRCLKCRPQRQDRNVFFSQKAVTFRVALRIRCWWRCLGQVKRNSKHWVPLMSLGHTLPTRFWSTVTCLWNLMDYSLS